MATTYEKIASTTLGAAAATITFSSIAATYTDLRLVLTSLSSTGNTQYFTLNTDTGTNYSYTMLYGTGAAASSFRTTSGSRIDIASDVVSASSTIPFFVTVDIFSYAGSTYKTCLVTSSEDLNGSGVTVSRVGLWRSTSAINQIVINRTAGNYNTGTTATLYGILKA
jgi:hypothetical protein